MPVNPRRQAEVSLIALECFNDVTLVFIGGGTAPPRSARNPSNPRQCIPLIISTHINPIIVMKLEI